jgi:multiple sugar transport system substrate-binding protein
MSLNRRRFLQLGGISAAALAAGQLPAIGQGQTNLRFAFWGPDARVRMLQAAAADFTAKNPDISVSLEFGTIANHNTRVTVGMASRSLPDVLWVTGEALPQMVAGGHVVDVSEFYGKGLDNAEFDAAVTSGGNINGGQFALTHGIQSVGLHANQAVLDELGIPVKRYPEAYSWAEFVEHCRAVHDAKGPRFFGTDDPTYVGAINHFRAFVRQGGEEYWTPDGDVGFSRDTLMAWLTQWQGMRESGAAIPAALHLEQPPYFEGSPMIRGLTAFHMRNSNHVLELQNLTQDPVVLMPVPGNGGENARNIGFDSNMISVAANTRYLEPSIRLLDYMLNDPDRASIMGTTIGAPSVASLRQKIAPDASPPERQFLEFIDFEAGVDAKPLPPAPATGAAFNSDVASAVEAMAYGISSVEQTVDTIFGELRDRLLAQS